MFGVLALESDGVTQALDGAKGRRVSDEETVPEPQKPRDFLKARCPHLFSDTEPVVEPHLPREVFDHHLASITSRKEEVKFEDFCTRIAEREICPNLRPQTGPTGGGDSKADSSSYVIDPELARRVFWGTSAAPSSQRWCFAYSAKKKWTGKVRSDVDGLVQVVPKPDKIYFITSQYARDKTRAEIEKELYEKHGVPVEILDRLWILTKTYKNGHTDIAAECFQIGTPLERHRRGPRDAAREAELEPLLEKLRKPTENYGSDYVLVKDYLRAAHLARSVDRPRHKMEGLLAQARRLAETTMPNQLLHANYDAAWTSFWWFDDAEVTLQMYTAMAESLPGTTDAHDLELHTNILNLLRTAVDTERLDERTVELEKKFRAVEAAADRLMDDSTRPANALEARSIKGMIALNLAIGRDHAGIASALDELHGCITSAEGLLHYPLLSYADNLERMGEFLAGFPAYDKLFDALCDLSGRLLGDRERAAMLLRNGFRLYEASRYPDALRALGEARRCALDKESVGLLADMALVTSLVYEATGLYWAARMEAAMAAHLAITESKSAGYANRTAVLATTRLVWLELRLGRLPLALAWHELAGRLLSVLRERGQDVEASVEDLRSQDGVLSLFFLAADEDTLRHLTKLPDTLERLGLKWSRWALLFALGHADVLQREGFQDDPAKLYALAFSQPAMSDIPSTKPTLHSTSRDTIETNLLGMRLRLEHENEISCIALAENIVSATEAWFATATWEDVLFFRSNLEIKIRESGLSVGALPDAEELIRSKHEIRINPSWAEKVHEAAGRDTTFTDWILQFMAGLTVLARTRSGTSEKDFIEKLAHSESFARALTYLPISKMTVDDLGVGRHLLEHWEADTEYPVTRTEAWWRDAQSAARESASKKYTSASGQRDAPTVFDLIEVDLWDQAGWELGVQLVYKGPPPPSLGLGFKVPEKGVEIFERLKARLHKEPSLGLRVSIILGEGGDQCKHYAIAIGPDLNRVLAARKQDSTETEKELIVGINRVLHLVRTPTSQLGRFIGDVKSKGKFTLIPVSREGSTGIRARHDLAIECTNLVVRHATDVPSSGDEDAGVAKQVLKGRPDKRQKGTKRRNTSKREKKRKR